MKTFVSQPHNGTIYILEPSRAGSRKLVASAMPAGMPAADKPILFRLVPLVIRREAKGALLRQ